MKKIGYVRSDFSSKFGIPRQSGLVHTEAKIFFLPPYNNPDAVRGLEEFSHIWVIWEFSENLRSNQGWSPTVRPPRLGGNLRKGVFATRSPFRPNPIGLSCVRLLEIIREKEGPVLLIEGGDMLDGTPVYDIKPYIPYADSVPEASGGFADEAYNYSLAVRIPEHLRERIPKKKQTEIEELLAQDPRPSYQEDPGRQYGMTYGEMEIKFVVKEGLATVTEVEKRNFAAGDDRQSRKKNLQDIPVKKGV